MMASYCVRQVEQGIWQITDVLDDRAYVVVGKHAALLVDTTIGCGDLREVVNSITSLPLTVALTHNHYDHTGGMGWFDEVLINRLEMPLLEREQSRGSRVHDRMLQNGKIEPDEPFAFRDGAAPKVHVLEEGDVFDLGGVTAEAVLLPGHTAGSMGFLVRECGVLLSGDAVTPIMCLFFEESLSIDVYRATLAKMAGLPFERFYTGHHDVGLGKSTLASFDACAEFALTARGVPWRHTMLPELVGTAYLAPCDTLDADSPDFRALIGPYVPRSSRRKRDGI